MAYRIYRTPEALLIEDSTQPGSCRQAGSSFSLDALFTSESPAGFVAEAWENGAEATLPDPTAPCAPPIGNQEIWASGVTYYRSRTARMEEAESSGGDVFYDLVYEAERPELFFKATAPRARGHRDQVAIRDDSTWDVPEPELTLAISSHGAIFGYTIGNDMSSRSIEGENPLYLPQAKVYTASCSIGPCLVVGDPPGPDGNISIEIQRGGEVVFSGDTTVSQLKRTFDELAEWLFRSNEFADGAYLMTGTGIVPDSDFSLAKDDEIAISIDGAGTLVNSVRIV